jgi:hypothetical protein
MPQIIRCQISNRWVIIRVWSDVLINGVFSSGMSKSLEISAPSQWTHLHTGHPYLQWEEVWLARAAKATAREIADFMVKILEYWGGMINRSTGERKHKNDPWVSSYTPSLGRSLQISRTQACFQISQGSIYHGPRILSRWSESFVPSPHWRKHPIIEYKVLKYWNFVIWLMKLIGCIRKQATSAICMQQGNIYRSHNTSHPQLILGETRI